MNLNQVDGVLICDACLDGHGGECHTPGCIFWIVSAPDIPIRQRIKDMGGEIKVVGDVDEMEKELEDWKEFQKSADYKFELVHGKQLANMVREALRYGIPCSNTVCQFFYTWSLMNCAKMCDGEVLLDCSNYIPSRFPNSNKKNS